MLLVAKMVGQLGMHRTLYKSTRQLLQQALFADQVLRSLVIRKQLVDDSFVDSHTSLLVLRNLHLHKILNALQFGSRAMVEFASMAREPNWRVFRILCKCK